eukprot:1009703-Prorocentrum_minimum.AAC.1
MRWLYKVSMVISTVTVSSPNASKTLRAPPRTIQLSGRHGRGRLKSMQYATHDDIIAPHHNSTWNI